MTRGAIYAGKAAILLTVQDQIDRGLVAVRNKLRLFSNSLGEIGSQSLRGGILGSIGSGFMLKRFTEFSDELLNLQAKLGYFGNMTVQQSANMASLVARIRDLGKSTSFTSKEVAEAATQLAQAGFSIKEIKDSLQPVLDLARGAGYGLAESAAMMANAIRTFNLDTAQANTVVSQFVKATRLGTIEIDDLREALKYASGSAVNLEQTLPTLLGLFVQMSEAGLKGSLAGTSLNTAMLNLVQKFKEMEQTLEGFHLVKNQQGMLDLIGTLEALYNATARMSKLERVAVFQDIFNIRGARAVSSTQEIERVIKFAREIRNAGNEARLAALTMDSDLGGAARRATGAFDDLGKSIGFAVNVPLQGLLEALPAVADRLDHLVRKFPGITASLVALPFALVGIGVAFLGLSFTLRRVAGLVDLVLGGFRKLANVASKGTLLQAGFLKSGTLFGKGTSLGQLKAFPGVLKQAVSRPTQAGAAANFTKQAATVWKDKALILSQAQGFERRAEALKKNLQYERALFGAMQKRGVASSTQLAAQAAKIQTMSLGINAARANASGLRSVAGGIKIFSGINWGRQIAQIGKNLLTLAKGFWAVTRGVLRFTFSFTGFWTIIEALLLFGDKIPVVAGGLERLGRGFKLAFGEIGKIARLATPAINLISFSLKALTEGDGANSELGFQALATGLKGLVDIVGNQLYAAWQRLVIAVAPFYDFLRKIVSSLFEIVGLTLQMALNFAGGRFSALGQIFSGSGAKDWNTIFKEFIQGLGWVIGSAFGIADAIASVFDQFLFKFQMMMIDLLEMAKLIWPSTADRKRAEAAVIKGQQDVAHTQRKIDRQAAFEQFWDDIERIFTTNTETIAKGKLGVAQQTSANVSSDLQAVLEEYKKMHQAFMEARAAEIARLQAEKVTGGDTLPGAAAGPAFAAQKVALTKMVHAVVGSAQDTRNNLLLRASYEEKSLDNDKKQTQTLESIDGRLEEIQQKGGQIVFQR